jgi:hypothetical protein
MAEDFINITPRSIDPVQDGQGRKTIFQETEWHHIKNNPANLTKEGMEKKISLWKNSYNTHAYIKYKTMLHQCKIVAESGENENGRIVYSRDADGTPKWVESELEFKKRKPKAQKSSKKI